MREVAWLILQVVLEVAWPTVAAEELPPPLGHP